MRLRLFTYIASEHGLSSVATLIVGSEAAVLINPPLLLQDAHAAISFIRSKTSNPLAAVFATHHHSDHYFSANIFLEAFPAAKFYAASYVVEAVEQEYENQVVYWSKMLGPSSVTSTPIKPEPYNYSFFVLPGDQTSPVVLLGPMQGCCPDHTVFWLPTERTIIAGDTVFARSTHLLLEEIEGPINLAAWRLTLDLIYSLDPITIVTGHVEKGTQFDASKDMEHMYKYLDLFEEKVIGPRHDGKQIASAQELFRTFEDAFPFCVKNVDFFLGGMAKKFGNSERSMSSNGSNRLNLKSKQELEGFVLATEIVN